MTTKTNEYRRIDFSKISFAKEPVSMSETLKNVASAPQVSKMKITKAKKDYCNKCVKLETSY